VRPWPRSVSFPPERPFIALHYLAVTSNDAPFTRDAPDWRVERTLHDGTRVILRALVPEDKEALRDAFAHLSFETRYMRFFSVVSEPSEAVLRYLTSVDQENHVAIVAGVESLDLKAERGVGIARFVRVAGEPHVAEAAVTVIDEFQRRGIGTVLLIELTRAAIARGVRVFRGEVLATNEGMLQILESVGAKLDPIDPHLEPADIEPGALAREIHPEAHRFEVTLEPEPRLESIVHVFQVAARTMATQLRSLFDDGTGRTSVTAPEPSGSGEER
jgi:GNAT superfamily N-acetyltransferase